MQTCFTAMLIFLASHSNSSGNFGWFVTNNESTLFTWFKYYNGNIHYFCIGEKPKDSRVPVKETGKCILNNGKVVPVLEYNVRVKK